MILPTAQAEVGVNEQREKQISWASLQLQPSQCLPILLQFALQKFVLPLETQQKM